MHDRTHQRRAWINDRFHHQEVPSEQLQQGQSQSQEISLQNWQSGWWQLRFLVCERSFLLVSGRRGLLISDPECAEPHNAGSEQCAAWLNDNAVKVWVVPVAPRQELFQNCRKVRNRQREIEGESKAIREDQTGRTLWALWLEEGRSREKQGREIGRVSSQEKCKDIRSQAVQCRGNSVREVQDRELCLVANHHEMGVVTRRKNIKNWRIDITTSWQIQVQAE